MKKNSVAQSTGTSMLRRMVWVLGWVLFLNLFLYHRIGSVATALIFNVYWLFVLGIFKRKINSEKLVTTGVSVISAIFSLIILTVENSFARAIVILSWAGILNLAIYLFDRGESYFENLEELILAPVRLSVAYILSGLNIIKDLFTGEFINNFSFFKKQSLSFKILFSLGLGLLIGIPIIAVMVALLSSGDPVFSHFVGQIFQNLGKIFSLKFWARPIGHLVFSVIMLGFFLPLGLMQVKGGSKKYLPENLTILTEISVVLGMVSAVLGTFLLVQWNYVFVNVAAETKLIKFGVNTYSEYVRHGFLEFLLVSIIVYSLLRLSQWVGGSQKIGQRILNFLQLLLTAEFLIFISSIFRRIYLYQSLHGWSLSRIYGGIFLLWVLGLVLILIWKQFNRRNLLLVESILTLGIVILVGLFNAENFIATTHPPTVNKRIDYIYLSRMDSDGYEGWKKAYLHAEQVLTKTNWAKEKVVGCEIGTQQEINGKIVNTKCVIEKKAKVIDSEGRREIAYAGSIVRYLLSSYNSLIKDYGSSKEQLEYSKAVLAYVRQWENRGSYANYKTNTDEEKLDFLGITNIWTGGWDSYYANSDGSYGYGYLYGPYYEPHGLISQRFPDNVYVWNYSEWRTYQQMKTEISFKNLLNLRESYLKYYQQIANQVEGEREFDFDVSLDSPFLN